MGPTSTLFGMTVAEKLQSPCGAECPVMRWMGPLQGANVLGERHLLRHSPLSCMRVGRVMTSFRAIRLGLDHFASVQGRKAAKELCSLYGRGSFPKTLLDEACVSFREPASTPILTALPLAVIVPL